MLHVPPAIEFSIHLGFFAQFHEQISRIGPVISRRLRHALFSFEDVTMWNFGECVLHIFVLSLTHLGEHLNFYRCYLAT